MKTLYRTNQFNNMSIVDLKKLINYEVFDMENDDVLIGFANIAGAFTEGQINNYISIINRCRDCDQRKRVENIIDSIFEKIKEVKKVDLKYGIWLYPLENVKEYYSFEGIDPLIEGYSVSPYKIMEYTNEGSLYAYESMPNPVEKI